MRAAVGRRALAGGRAGILAAAILATLAAGATASGCGDDVPGRSFELDVRGLSARASALVVKLRVEAVQCAEVTLATAPGMPAYQTERWERASGAPRSFTLSPVVTETVTLIAYALDGEAPLQVGCRTVTYAELGNLAGGRVTLVLSRRETAASLEQR